MEQFDPSILDKIVHQLKSQGIFDQFRRECMSDVDTKPAYQNLRQRVDGSVSSFLSTSEWRPELNKNQLRDTLRKHIQSSGFLDAGVERIVDQVVNPKICPLFLPKVEEIVYDCLGLNKRGIPEKMGEKSSTKTDEPCSLQSTSAPREEIDADKKEKTMDEIITKITETTFNPNSLLPQDLEPISPASEEKLVDTNESDDNIEDEETSPPFELHTDGNSDDSHAHLQHNSFSLFKTEMNLNSDLQGKTNSSNNENVEIENRLKESPPEYDIFVKDNIGNKHTGFKMLHNHLNNHEMYKKPSPKSDDNETSSVEPETSVGSSLGMETSDEISSSQEKESSPTKMSKLKIYSHDSDSEIICDSTTIESSKKVHNDLKGKIATSSSVSSSHSYKKSHSSSSKSSTKDHRKHRRHHRHDRKSSQSSSHSTKSSSKLKHSEYDKKDKNGIDKIEKDHKRCEDTDVKHKMRARSRDEKIKHTKDKIVHKSQTKETETNVNGNFLTNGSKDKIKGNHSDLKYSIENKRENTYIESKHDKHRHSSKHYSPSKKEDHSWNENEQTSISITNIKDGKKTTDRDKRHKISNMKYSKKHKSSEKFKEGRSSDRENFEQREELNITEDSLNYQSDSKDNALPESNITHQSSKDIILFESEEESNHDYSSPISTNNRYCKMKNNVGEHENITLKPSIKKKHSNVYEVRKKIQARKSLERLRKKREQTEVEQRKTINTDFDVNSFDATNIADKKMRTHCGKAHKEENTEIIQRYSVNQRGIQLSSSNSVNENDQIFPVSSTSSKLEYDHTKTKPLCKVPNVFIRKITSKDGENTNLKPKFEVKLQSDPDLDLKQKINEVLINQENEAQKLTNTNNENTNFAIVKIGLNNEISVMPMKADTNPDIPTIRCVSKKKKSVISTPISNIEPKSGKTSDENKIKISRKRTHNFSNDESVTGSGHSDSIVRSRVMDESNLDTGFGDSRQNKILKLIMQDGKNEASFEEKESLISSQSTEEDLYSQTYSNSTQTDTDDYTKKPPKLATKLMDVALQDLLMESGLSLPCTNESHRKLTTNVKQGSTTSTKRTKPTTEKAITSHQQQHYDKSDLYKPRPCFTKSSKRSRRGDTHDDSSLEARHVRR